MGQGGLGPDALHLVSFWRLLGNIIWLVTFCLALAVSLATAGVVMCITIIGIPFGLQAFKLAVYALWPFGSEVVQVTATAPGCLGNVIWFVFGGLFSALWCLVLAVVACVLIVTIPFGIILFRMVPLIAFPFGKAVVPMGSASSV